MSELHTHPWRKTTQPLAPAEVTQQPEDGYVLYPGFPVPPGQISIGWDSLAGELAKARLVTLDGFGGVFWDHLKQALGQALAVQGVTVEWTCIDQALRPEQEIDALVAPFLGGDDPLFGARFTGTLADFFDPGRLRALQPRPAETLQILYGCGAALAGWPGRLVYVDVPKNEIQFRSRAGTIANLGASTPCPPKEMYKRFYFVDWVALNRHKANLLPRLDLIVDGQRPDQPTWARGEVLRAALGQMAHNYFRVRPWFEPGPWGGKWIYDHVVEASRDVPNYAWSFEMISPENGLALESAGRLLEVSFDCLMYQEYQAVLGKCAGRFRYEFPIRFGFDDTIDGGNLSIQVHPRLDYIRRNFGETFTQDETYYILDAAPGSSVYLGFQAGIDPDEFRRELERSYIQAAEIQVERFVQRLPSQKHDLFLIPNGTIHGSGRNNLVLEISATPYIYTFKMYDWLRLDLEGKPRPLNIERAFQNLDFRRQGERVPQELVSKPVEIASGPGWRTVHLPTHPEMFFDIQRHEFEGAIEIETAGSAQVLMLVEGEYVWLETHAGMRQRFNYAETFAIPAAAGRCRLAGPPGAAVKVVKAFMKADACKDDAPA